MTPTDPPKSAIGTNTADSTSAMAISAVWISPIDWMVASRGDISGFSSSTRSTFSTTTIASSTSSPIDSTTPNSVSTLMEKPHSARMPNVPSSTTGTAIAGISVARQLCRKTNITITTSTIASNSVLTTSSTDSLMNAVASCGNEYL